MNEILFGDCREIMRRWAEQGVKAQMCVTSPPYFGLRDYGVDGQLGLERTPDEYVQNMVEVFRVVRDVLADDGTLWLNIGDSYANVGKWGGSSGGKHASALHGNTGIGRGKRDYGDGLKNKDLIGIPWRVAFALQADGWYLRQDIIWHKPNAMPESVRDRCTKAHEYVFLLSKSERYFFDSEAMKEPAVSEKPAGNKRHKYADAYATGDSEEHRTKAGLLALTGVEWEKRNRRSVWTVATRPYKGAHFATYPPALIEPCILAGSRPGDIVLDPFMGSGTTAEVAILHGRQYLGCELNEEYRGLQDARIRGATR
jgi:DNA modification methylase